MMFCSFGGIADGEAGIEKGGLGGGDGGDIVSGK
jgi:hypothetical protein